MSRAITPRVGERWLASSLPVGRASATMTLVALGSLAMHVAFVGATAVAARAPPVPPQEIAVEIVQEVPKPAEKRPEPSKVAEAAKGEPAKEEPTKPDPIKTDQAKIEQPQPESPKVEPAKPEPPKPAPIKAEAKPQSRPEPEQKLAQLQNELESLKAEQAELEAERAAQRQPAALRDTGMGALPDSFQAIALPAAADGQGEATSYQAIVFSALAKAKGIGGEMGLPGRAGVQFDIDATGKLVEVTLVHRSGVASLDAQALEIVRRAAPFPPPPQGAQRNFSANFNFETDTH